MDFILCPMGSHQKVLGKEGKEVPEIAQVRKPGVLYWNDDSGDRDGRHLRILLEIESISLGAELDWGWGVGEKEGSSRTTRFLSEQLGQGCCSLREGQVGVVEFGRWWDIEGRGQRADWRCGWTRCQGHRYKSGKH